VAADGCIYFPLAGRLRVAGCTVPEARDLLVQALGKFLQDPQADLKVLTYRSQKVYVGGEVKAPGVYPVTDVPFNLAEIASRTGGFLPTSDLSRVTLVRGDQRWTFNFLDLLEEGSRFGRIFLKDGDNVQIPSRDEAPVYLMGEVRNPRSVPLYHGHLSLAQALSEAGGLSMPTADARSLYVLRQGTGPNAVDVYHLDCRNPVSMVLADRFSLRPRDVVFVDPGTLVRWNRVVSLLVPTVSALASTASDVKYLSQ
jgi:polysaccharide export outer membrane protein